MGRREESKIILYSNNESSLLIEILLKILNDSQLEAQQQLKVEENNMISLILNRTHEEYIHNVLEFKKDMSRSTFLTDARSKPSKHKNRIKKINRISIKKKVKNRHRRNR